MVIKCAGEKGAAALSGQISEEYTGVERREGDSPGRESAWRKRLIATKSEVGPN